MKTDPQADETRDADAELKQAEETSLPNALPNTRQFQSAKPNYGRTIGLIASIVILLVILALFAL